MGLVSNIYLKNVPNIQINLTKILNSFLTFSKTPHRKKYCSMTQLQKKSGFYCCFLVTKIFIKCLRNSQLQIKSKFDLTKLRLVNGVSEDEEEPEFELVFEKGSNVMAPLYVKWTADR